ncbi:protein windpipe [Culicoides brevitarsis]|uniref:protein windpipe n=1 Tax=Culicoides brevitarsis TaxID=469753 RepID=UPI00307BD694
MKSQPMIIATFFLFFTLTAAGPLDTSCPIGCACNITSSHAKCTTLSGLIRFDRTSSLESLDLSNLGLRKITSHLDKFPNLEKIDLSGNRLSEVNKLPKGITDLNLSNNRITSAKLAKIPKSVVNLNLSENHITYVPHSIMTLKYLRHLELSGNPINCTCDTLAVRNWLKAQHVWMDRHIICMAPLKFKGRPWLQMKQAEVCEVTIATKKATKFTSKYNWDEIENDNELMQGDQAAEGSGDEEVVLENHEYDEQDEYSNEPVDDPKDEDVDDYDEEEDEKEVHENPEIKEVKQELFIPVIESTTTTSTTTTTESTPVNDDNDDEEDNDYDEGSGDDPIPVVSVSSTTTEEEPSSSTTAAPMVSESVSDADDDYDDYGSGSPQPVVPVEMPSSTTESDLTFTETTEPTEVEEDTTDAVPLPDLDIFDESLATSSTTEDPEAVVVGRAGDVEGDNTAEDAAKKANVMQASSDDSKNTFILLGVLGVLLVVLIIYVSCKDKSSKRNRRGKGDVENGPARELKEMNKDLLGKERQNGHSAPKGGNVPEKSPLMKNGHDKPTNGHSFPAVSPNKMTDEVDHPANSSPMSTFKPIKETPVQEKPEPNNNHVNGSAMPEVHEPTPASPKRYSPVYTPRTPKLGNHHTSADPKYSPVYSPETGRVKIKATETPRAKTPVLVTRTKSSAGDYVTEQV